MFQFFLGGGELARGMYKETWYKVYRSYSTINFISTLVKALRTKHHNIYSRQEWEFHTQYRDGYFTG
jgi:hypothetical protein